MTGLRRAAGAAAIALGHAGVLRAQPQSASGIDAIDFSSMALSLGVVIAVIVVAAFVIRRTPLGFAARGSGPLKLVATLPLGPRERLMLVTMRGREVLIGVSPAGLSIAPVVTDATPGIVEEGDAGVLPTREATGP